MIPLAVLTQRAGDTGGPVFWHAGGVVPAVAALHGRIVGGGR